MYKKLIGIFGSTAAFAGVGIVPVFLGGGGEGEELIKPHREWKGAKDFKRYCYSNFLSEYGKGELIACQDKSQKQATPDLLFYLYWKSDDSFTLISQIKKEGSGGDTISFVSEQGSSSIAGKTIKFDSSQQNGINNLYEKTLKNICKITVDHNQDPYLECDAHNSRSNYRVKLRKETFNF